MILKILVTGVLIVLLIICLLLLRKPVWSLILTIHYKIAGYIVNQRVRKRVTDLLVYSSTRKDLGIEDSIYLVELSNKIQRLVAAYSPADRKSNYKDYTVSLLLKEDGIDVALNDPKGSDRPNNENLVDIIMVNQLTEILRVLSVYDSTTYRLISFELYGY